MWGENAVKDDTQTLYLRRGEDGGIVKVMEFVEGGLCTNQKKFCFITVKFEVNQDFIAKRQLVREEREWSQVWRTFKAECHLRRYGTKCCFGEKCA